YDANWERMLAMLAEFAREHDHCRVPSKWKDNLPLAKWVEGQRRKKKAARLLPHRIAALEKLGFEWRVSTYDPQPRVWNEMFERLKKYKELHGDCIVPQRYREDRQLAGWVSEQRMANNRGELTSERVQLLTDLGFDWNPIVTKWDEMFATLVEYKKQHGDVNVPQKSREYPKLAAWVAKQRYDKKKNKPISPPRARRLDELGFVWAFKDPFSWEHMFALLVDYKKNHSHCNVPQNWRENKQLGKWVNTQRTHYKRGKLSPDRQRQLEGLGFVWSMLPTRDATHRLKQNGLAPRTR
ncbi:MAG: helicase associated domain-containing protein, partial [Limisphaerales bacterium]